MNLTLIKTVFAILCSFTPTWGEDEPTHEREARLGVVATAIVVAADGDKRRIAKLITQAKHESHLSRRIHEGRCKRWECDFGATRIGGKRVVIHRARSIWQSHHIPNDSEATQWWIDSVGTDFVSTLAAARLADRHMQNRRCRDDLRAAFGSLDGRGCRATPNGDKKTRTYQRVIRRLK